MTFSGPDCILLHIIVTLFYPCPERNWARNVSCSQVYTVFQFSIWVHKLHLNCIFAENDAIRHARHNKSHCDILVIFIYIKRVSCFWLNVRKFYSTYWSDTCNFHTPSTCTVYITAAYSCIRYAFYNASSWHWAFASWHDSLEESICHVNIRLIASVKLIMQLHFMSLWPMLDAKAGTKTCRKNSKIKHKGIKLYEGRG